MRSLHSINIINGVWRERSDWILANERTHASKKTIKINVQGVYNNINWCDNSHFYGFCVLLIIGRALKYIH